MIGRPDVALAMKQSRIFLTTIKFVEISGELIQLIDDKYKKPEVSIGSCDDKVRKL